MLHSDYHSEVRDELHKRLQQCHAYLAECLDQTELLHHLISEDVVTTSDVESIKAEKGAFKQNCSLLDVLQSKSFTQIEGFIDCLLKTNQANLVQRIDSSGTEYKFICDKLNDFNAFGAEFATALNIFISTKISCQILQNTRQETQINTLETPKTPPGVRLDSIDTLLTS